ncbi:MAG: hypothetical protein IT548_04955 [Alphaproteobacteria bacterium]|nr:hypothetical protein [Alphaproteobacteria bacterium]
MEMTLTKWILILVFITAGGGITTTSITGYGSKDECSAAGVEAASQFRADGVSLRTMCVTSP